MDSKCSFRHVLSSFTRCVLCSGGTSDASDTSDEIPYDNDATASLDVEVITMQETASISSEAVRQFFALMQKSNESIINGINNEYSFDSDSSNGSLNTVPESSKILGRFSTLNRPKKPIPSTSNLREYPAILDDFNIGQVQHLLQYSHRWEFNVFFLDSLTGGYSLPHLGVYLFEFYGLIEHFKLDIICVRKLFVLIESGYYNSNPYHCSVHATDVTQAMHCFLMQNKIRPYVTPIEIMASIIAAASHDIYHPGVNQSFLTATSNYFSNLFNNKSVLENHHWRCTISCIIESNIAEQLESSSWSQLKNQVRSLILATDILRQGEFIFKFNDFLNSPIDMNSSNDRQFILQIALKCADIANPCRPWELSRQWSKKVCEEFFRQGDYERQLSLSLSDMCDRMTTSIPKIQIAFLRFFVRPLIEEWDNFMQTKLTGVMLLNLIENQKRWDGFVLEELSEEARNNTDDIMENKDLLDSKFAHIEEITNHTYNNTRRSSAPPERKTQLHVLQSRRESFPCYIQYITLEEKMSFKDGIFLHHSSQSLGLDRYKNQFQNIHACENLLPNHSIATLTQNSDQAIHIRNIILGDAELNIPTIQREFSTESVQHILCKVQSSEIKENSIDDVSPVKNTEIKLYDVNRYKNKFIEYKVKARMNVMHGVKNFLMKCDPIWGESTKDILDSSSSMFSHHLTVPCLSTIDPDLSVNKLKKSFSFPGYVKHEIKVADIDTDKEETVFGSPELTASDICLNEEMEVENLFF